MAIKFSTYDPTAPKKSGATTAKRMKMHEIKKDTVNIFRIAPPFGRLEERKDFGIFRRLHWGFSQRHPEKDEWVVSRPFECVERTKKNGTEKTVTQVCDECVWIADRTAEYKVKAALLASGTVKDEKKLNALIEEVDYLNNAINGDGKHYKGAHQLQGKWYVYAKDITGTWAFLVLGHKTKIQIDDMIKAAQADKTGKKIDPLHPVNGCWLQFTKNGRTGSDANVSIEVVTEIQKINGVNAVIIKMDEITEADMTQIENLPDIVDFHWRPSATQVKAMVESGGDPDVVAAAFNASGEREASPAPKSVPAPAVTTTLRMPPPKTSNPGPGVSPPSFTEKPRPAPMASPIPTTVEDDNVAMSEEELRKHFAR